jgi:HEAT repeat protein
VRQAAVQVLGRFPGEVVLELTDALKDKEAGVRWTAAMYLGGAGAAAKKAVPALKDLAGKDDNPNVRYYALNSLAQIDGEKSVPTLIELLKKKDTGLRQAVLNVLPQFGPKGKEAVPTLIELLADKEPNVRWQSAYALGQIGKDAKEAIPALKTAAKDKDPNVQQYAQMALQLIDQK